MMAPVVAKACARRVTYHRLPSRRNRRPGTLLRSALPPPRPAIMVSRRAGPHRAGLDLPPSLRAAVKKIQGARACVGSSGIGSSGWSQLAPCRICRRVRRRASACLRARPRGPAMPLPPGARLTGAVGSRIQGRGAGSPVRRRAGVVTTMAAVFEFRNLIITARCYHWFWARRRTPPVGTARVYSYTMSSPVRSDDGRDGSRSWLTLH